MHADVVLFLLGLAVLLGSARLLGFLVGRVGFPAVVGEILAGIVVGKTVLGRLAPDVFARLFADGAPKTLLTGYTTVGAVLLLVVAGLEVDLSIVRKSSRAAVLTSLFGAVMPFALGYGAGMWLPDGDLADPSRRGLHAAFLGIALSISALPVIAKTLMDLGIVKTDIGLIVLSAAVLDDLVGWTGFSVLSRQFGAKGSTSTGSILISVAVGLAFVAATLLFVRPLVDKWLARAEKKGEVATGRTLSIIMVLALLSAAATEGLGMHAVFGGFVAGLAVGDSKRLREHTRNVLEEFVTSVFTPVYFATLALRFDFVAAFDLKLVSIILFISCVAKVVGCTVGARMGGVSWKPAFTIAFGMNSRGAMEILLASLALEAHIISVRIFVALVVMAIVTSLVSGPAMAYFMRARQSPAIALLKAGVVLLDVKAAGPKEIIEALAAAIAEKQGRAEDAKRFAEATLAREEMAGTGIGNGVAIPHAEVAGLSAPLLAMARVDGELDFNAPDGEGVRLVFLLLTPPRAFGEELQVLAAIAKLLIHDEVRASLLAAPDSRALFSALDRADRASPKGAAVPVAA